jgi:DNA polymerase
MWEKFGKASDLPKRTYLACDAIKHMWRAKHPKTTEGWKCLKNAAIMAVENPGKVFGLPNKKVMFSVRDRWLVVLLPSGRKLRYFEPRVTGTDRDKVLSYLGVDMWNLEKEGYPVVMTVHDEAVVDTPVDYSELEVMTKFYTRKEAWAKDFPLAAEGFVADRFRK